MTMDTMDTMDVMGSDAAGAAGVATSTDGLYVSPTSFIQTAENRFGANVLDDLRAFVSGAPQDIDLAFEDEDSGVDDEDDEPIDEEVFLEANQWVTHLSPGLETDHAQHGFPRIATTRNNLTALSQRYNVGLLLRYEGDRHADPNLRYSSTLPPTKTGSMSTGRVEPGPRYSPLRPLSSTRSRPNGPNDATGCWTNVSPTRSIT
jgi:hypothetical protein